MGKAIKKILFIMTGVIIISFAVALIVKSNFGVGAWDAVSKAVADILQLKIGDIMMILNVSCILGQILILRKSFKLIQLLQIVVVFTLSYCVNFFVYDFPHTSNIAFDSIFMNVVMLFIAYIICAMGVSLVMCIDYISMPLEACCMAATEVTSMKFGKIRQLVDVVCVALAVILMFTFGLDNIIGFGTIAGMFVFGPLLDFFMPKLQPLADKICE